MLKNVPLPPPEQLTPRGREYANPANIKPSVLGAAERDAQWPLEPEELMRRAREQCGLEDFGPEPFLEPLTVLCRSLRGEVELSDSGRANAYGRLMTILTTRLRLQDLWRRRPEILELPVRRPLFVFGLPRSGTTFLQHLLSQDGEFRTVPYWELMNPLPLGDPEQPVPQPDPRIGLARQALERLHAAAPDMVQMHRMEAETPEEEIALVALSFCSMAFEWSFSVPSYVDYYAHADHLEGYRYFKRVLQTLQWLRGGEQWLLKAPMHMEMLQPLLTVFPDAVIVQTHRDPVTATVSLTDLTCYGRRFYFDHPNPLLVGEHLSAAIERLLRRFVDYRAAHPEREAQFLDIHFRDLMADPIAAVRAVYRLAGRELAPAMEAKMRAWIAANPKDKHGAHTYAAADFGIDAAERRAALRFYSERYGVPDDNMAG